jgi:hypothetical protein
LFQLFVAETTRIASMTVTRDPKAGSGPKAPISSVGEQVLAHAQSGREVVQDFCPLAQSLN